MFGELIFCGDTGSLNVGLEDIDQRACQRVDFAKSSLFRKDNMFGPDRGLIVLMLHGVYLWCGFVLDIVGDGIVKLRTHRNV